MRKADFRLVTWRTERASKPMRPLPELVPVPAALPRFATGRLIAPAPPSAYLVCEDLVEDVPPAIRRA